MNISLCIATYRRPERLGALLDDLVKQQQLPIDVVVVDNDAAGSARAVVKRRRELGAPFPIHYDIQPVKNISLTRNRTVALANSDWIAFIDDDERAPAGWLKKLSEAAIRCNADGVLGPVEPVVPANAPAWIQHGSFYEWWRMKTCAVIPPNKLRFGNVLLRGALLRDTPTPFDPDYGLTGGEDGDLLGRLVQQGARIVWCDEAIVHEPVEGARLSLRWLLLRALRGGQDFARHWLAGSYGQLTSTGRVRLFLRALLQSALAAGLAFLSWPLGRHRAVYWLLKASANIGKITILLGWHYREYGGKDT
ncbi:glycosyl transferase [Sulfuricaulis limicola]|uniref:Glycosyl transferase n=1 Tax=Sulfuricaulis limicola TaxID=1620215 RepID=A0A1B4XH35_9GAMM|nr:glycosyltransferase family 2 protein [Sulfuricaulis limicola]BAV34115.1 glycosyl transferase [Sulfuricaulis limicola]